MKVRGALDFTTTAESAMGQRCLGVGRSAKSYVCGVATLLRHQWSGCCAIQQRLRNYPPRVATATPRASLLAPICNWFTEGFDTHDLKGARELFGSLH